MEVSSDGHHRVSFESRRQRENENRSEEDREEDLLVHVHTEENSVARERTYPNSTARAECHFGFGCQRRATGMNGPGSR